VPNSTKIPKAKSEPEERFNIAWRSLGGPKPEREYRFCERKWRFDFAWPEVRIAVEIEGGINEGKRRGYHMRKEGFLKDRRQVQPRKHPGLEGISIGAFPDPTGGARGNHYRGEAFPCRRLTGRVVGRKDALTTTG
jgi:hypothetical protein